ncbi:MAG: hypothetical protein ACRCYE_13820 [Sarcina sp.]
MDIKKTKKRLNTLKYIAGLGFISIVGVLLFQNFKLDKVIEIEKVKLLENKNYQILDGEKEKILFSKDKKILYLYDEKTEKANFIARSFDKNYSITTGELEGENILYTEELRVEDNNDTLLKQTANYINGLFLADIKGGKSVSIMLSHARKYDIDGENIAYSFLDEGNNKEVLMYYNTTQKYGVGIHSSEEIIQNISIDGNIITFNTNDKVHVIDITGTTGAETKLKSYTLDIMQNKGVAKDGFLYSLSVDSNGKTKLLKSDLRSKVTTTLLDTSYEINYDSLLDVSNGKVIISTEIMSDNKPKGFVGYVDIKTKEVTRLDENKKIKKVVGDELYLEVYKENDINIEILAI